MPTTYNTKQLDYTISDLYYFREMILTIFLVNSNVITEILNKSLVAANKEPGLVRSGYIDSLHSGFEYGYDHKIPNNDIRNAILSSIVLELASIGRSSYGTKFDELSNKLRSMSDEACIQFVQNALDLLDMSTDKVSYYRIMIT